MTATAPPADATPTARTNRRATPATLAVGAAVGAAAAVVANLVVFAIGSIGAPLEVVMTGDTTASELPAAAVIGASIAPIVVGAVGLWIFERFLANGFRIWAVTAGVLAVVSIAAPAGLDVSTESKVALAVMHLVVGAAAIAGQLLARRRRGLA